MEKMDGSNNHNQYPPADTGITNSNSIGGNSVNRYSNISNKRIPKRKKF